VTIRTARARSFAERLEAARAREVGEYVFEIEWYCDHDTCPARTVVVRIKEIDGPTDVTRAPSCPLCRSPLKTHHVSTLSEANAVFCAEARSSVNAQLYMERERRRLGDPEAIVPIPIGVLLDDTLPRVAQDPG
jgi:hypothetical protein